MAYLMGIDVGTSSIKTIIIDECGTVAAISACGYQYDSPVLGYAEQDPEVWWQACEKSIQQALSHSGLSGQEIMAVGFSGQMHGLVMLDAQGKSVRPAILHCDARSGPQVQRLQELFIPWNPQELVMNPLYPGFLLPSLLWVRDNEPEHFDKIKSVCLPKDYIKYRLEGRVSTDYSDASATLAFDIRKREWSNEILSCTGLAADWFPHCFEPHEIVGTVCEHAARATGLSTRTLVVAGGADAVMQGIGNGAIHAGIVTTNIGSSGQICFQSNTPIENPKLTTNCFCGFKEGRWITMGAIMQAGLALRWFKNISGDPGYTQLDAAAELVGPGSGGLIFLPYLNGERTPHMNPDLSGMFLGCNMSTTRKHMARAVMEGVTFALNQCMEICKGLGLSAKSVVTSGGGAQSPLWRQIQADIFNRPLRVALVREQAALGAAIAAGVGAKIYKDVEEGCDTVVRYRPEIIEPDEKNHTLYAEYYEMFKEAYTANHDLLVRAVRLGRRQHKDLSAEVGN